MRILLGILLFTALLFLTRVIQRRLRENVLVAPRMDAGIAHSIDTAVGYLGTALAAIIAISYAGFDITSLAIVAGALSVGIGFGLQSIVNNFVSGLILLIERPIKVGDWVVVGNEQGNVKRISVRSTEIETFDRASLIVPNSELITGRVLNWTHRNALGRVVLKFNAGPDADPRRVLAILDGVRQAATRTCCATRPRSPSSRATHRRDRVFAARAAPRHQHGAQRPVGPPNRCLRGLEGPRIDLTRARRARAVPSQLSRQAS